MVTTDKKIVKEHDMILNDQRLKVCKLPVDISEGMVRYI